MFYVIENDYRPDGVVNNTVIGRTTLAMAKSYYFDRKSKALVSEQFTRVALLLVDADLNYFEHDTIETLYKEPEPETDEV